MFYPPNAPTSSLVDEGCNGVLGTTVGTCSTRIVESSAAIPVESSIFPLERRSTCSFTSTNQATSSSNSATQWSALLVAGIHPEFCLDFESWWWVIVERWYVADSFSDDLILVELP